MSNQKEAPTRKEPLVHLRVQMSLPESVVKAIRQEAEREDRKEADLIARKLKECYGKG